MSKTNQVVGDGVKSIKGGSVGQGRVRYSFGCKILFHHACLRQRSWKCSGTLGDFHKIRFILLWSIQIFEDTPKALYQFQPFFIIHQGVKTPYSVAMPTLPIKSGKGKTFITDRNVTSHLTTNHWFVFGHTSFSYKKLSLQETKTRLVEN